MTDRFPEQAESDLTYLVDQRNGDRMMKQLLNSVITKYRDLSVSHSSILIKCYYYMCSHGSHAISSKQFAYVISMLNNLMDAC